MDFFFSIYRSGNILSQSEQIVLYKFIQAITALFFPLKLYLFIIYNKINILYKMYFVIKTYS